MLIPLLWATLWAGCRPEDRSAPTQTSAPGLSDAAHGGRPGFYFLPPVAPLPSPKGAFDPHLWPTARLCVLSGSECDPGGLTFLLSAGRGSQPAPLGLPADYYEVRLPPELGLVAARRHRIRILAEGLLLGHADFRPADLDHDASGVPSVRFRVETGIVREVTLLPAAATVAVGDTFTYRAQAADLHGRPMVGSGLGWASSDPAVASVDPEGRAHASAVGRATISVATQGVGASAVLEVVPRAGGIP